MESSSAAAARTIDDFLEQLYQEYKRRLPSSSSSYTDTGSICRSYRFYLPLPLLALCIANSSDATEILMLSYLLANSTFRHDMFSSREDNNTTTTSMEGSLAASIFLGMLIGGTVLGFLSDHLGRRPILLAGLLTNAVAGFFSSLQILTPTISQLTFWRFIAGIGIGAGVPSLFSLASEWSPKEVRGSIVTLVASFWMIGSLFVSGLAWLLFRGNADAEQLSDQDASTVFPTTWRVFAALCAVPSALGAWFVYSYVPESARFLASSKQNYAKAAHVCNQLAISLDIQLGENRSVEVDSQRMNDTLLEEVESLHVTNKTCIQPFTEEELRRDYHATCDNISIGSPPTLTARLYQTLYMLLGSLQNLYSPQLFYRTTLPLQLIWFSLSFATYGITTWINTLFTSIHLQNIYFNSFLFALANLPGNVLSIVYSDRWGRKRMLVGSLIGAAGGLSLFAMIVYSGDAQSKSSSLGIVLSACMFQMFSIVSWNAIDILSSESFPTIVRSAGMGVCTGCGRFGGIFAQFVNARLMATTGDDAEGETASASVLIVAALSLIFGAGMPMMLERDKMQIELKDDIYDEKTITKKINVSLGCIGGKHHQKDHLSDDEFDNKDFRLPNRSQKEELVREDSDYRSLREESFLL